MGRPLSVSFLFCTSGKDLGEGVGGWGGSLGDECLRGGCYKTGVFLYRLGLTSWVWVAFVRDGCIEVKHILYCSTVLNLCALSSIIVASHINALFVVKSTSVPKRGGGVSWLINARFQLEHIRIKVSEVSSNCIPWFI